MIGKFEVTECDSRKYPYPLQEGSLEIPRGWGERWQFLKEVWSCHSEVGEGGGGEWIFLEQHIDYLFFQAKNNNNLEWKLSLKKQKTTVVDLIQMQIIPLFTAGNTRLL